ncbi:distal membrane-arm assembly complex protein 2 [Periophthalmus magnuspinnatus]|uniref:distal membrane-arm assembly complex protein 2 n=1 Tax=Periophthalmus magnuspinnatus TaxID=409849 RepID=UPI00145A3E18|nr:distal membrane-arm assembly complex protein 2 [Periophthalmus magnuspinnatus]
MAAPLLSLSRCCRHPVLLLSRCLLSSSTVSKAPLHTRLLLYLTKRFYDVEALLTWTSMFKKRGVRKKNAYYGYTGSFHGPHVAAAYFILNLKGGFRYRGRSDWFHAEKFDWDFINHKDCPLEEIDLSYTVINCDGLGNFDEEKSLRTLSLKACPEVDDWFLSRLHVFQDSLEELDISQCPRITIGGLAALRNLKGLKRLDVSSLPRIANPGLVVILLEEMLPKCHVIADGYEFDAPPKEEESGHREEMHR